MTVFTGTLTASSDQSGFEVTKATDGISGTGSRWAAANTSMPQTLTWDFGSPVVPKHYTLGPAIASTGQELTAWELRGSVSDATFATYDVLDSRSVSAASTTKRYALSNTTAYRYVRLHITASGGDVASTSDFQVSGGTIHKSFENVPGTIATYADGTPASVTVHSDGTTYNMGQIFSSTVDGNITHLRYYEPSGLSGTVTLRLYGAAGAVLASTTHTAVSSSSGWRDVALSSPYAITAGTEYMAAMRLPGGWYARCGNGGTQGQDLWWGTIKHPAVGNATYGSASTQGRLGLDDAVPSGYYGNSTYAVGVVFEEPSSSIDLTSPTATASAAASAATVALAALMLTSPAAAATAAAAPATVALQPLAVTSSTATATASAAPSTLAFGPIDLTSPTAEATTAAAPGTVSVGAIDLTSPTSSATAATDPAAVTFGTLSLTSPTAGASAAAAAGVATIGGSGSSSLTISMGLTLTLTGGVYKPGSLYNAILLTTSPQAVDFADFTDSPEPVPEDGDLAAVDAWYRYESAGSDTVTLTWAGAFSVGLEVWIVSLDDVFADLEEATLVASGEGPTLAFSSGPDQAYLIRVHPMDDANNAGTGSLSWTTAARPASGALGLEAVEVVYDTPAWLQASVLSATPDGEVEFEIDTVLVLTATADDAGTLSTLAIPVGVLLTVGTHTLLARDVTTGTEDSLTFDVESLTAEPDADPPSVGPATPATGGVIQWVFELPNPGGMTFTFPHNPTEMTSPFSRRVLNPEHTTAPDGQPIIFEGEPVATEWSATGVVFTEAHHDALEQWHALNRRFYAIDHHERAWLVTLEDVAWTAMRDPNRPWAHRYSLKFLIWGGPYELEEVP